MFLDLNQRNPQSVAIVDGGGYRVTYGELCQFAEEFYGAIAKRCLVLVLTENCAGACVGYVASMANRVVPMMLTHSMAEENIKVFLDTYHPSYMWLPEENMDVYSYPVCLKKYGYALVKTDLEPYPMAEELSLLLPTSGSTGSPKLVRHNYENVEANARAVATAFELDKTSRGMESLPLSFTQGLNVATSHLAAGGTVLLTKATLTDRKFWTFFREERAQSFTGVPYSYEVLKRLRFFQMDLPDLKIINQGGGRLPDALFDACAAYARDTGRKFIPTYGSTETTSRMSYLPAELAAAKKGSIGRPLPGYTMTLVDEDGAEIQTVGQIGEIVFRGPNVTLGYAERGEDLMLGDRRHGTYATGDMAMRDEDSCYYIVGRRARILKLYGFRVGLDESERLIKGELSISCACVGDDKQMRIYVEVAGKEEEIVQLLVENLLIPRVAFLVRVIDCIPKNDAGKTMYSALD